MVFVPVQIRSALLRSRASLVGLAATVLALHGGEARGTERETAAADLPSSTLEPVAVADRALPVAPRAVSDGLPPSASGGIPVVPLGFALQTTIARLAGSEEIEPLGRRELGIDVRPTEDVSRNWFVNEFVHELERRFTDETHTLLDEDSVLSGSRIFGARWGVGTETFENRLAGEEMTAEEELIFRSGIEAVKDTLSLTDAYQILYGRIQEIELYFNWSLVHAEQDFSHVVRLYTPAETVSKKDEGIDVVSKLDTRFRLASLIDDPDEMLELRGRIFRHLNFSFYPMNRRLEFRTTLVDRRGLRVGLTLSEEPGHGRTLVLGLTAGF